MNTEIIITIIGTILGIIFGILSLTNVKLRLKLSKNISWRDIKKAFEKLEPEIRQINPDVVVGLADGRIIGAIIVANLRFPFFYTIDNPIKYDEKGKRIINIMGEVGNIKDKHVLLVDNHIYTGTNMEAAKKHLYELGASKITTLVFFKHEVGASASKIDHFAYTIKGKRKVMPWSYTKEHDNAYYIELSGK